MLDKPHFEIIEHIMKIAKIFCPNVANIQLMMNRNTLLVDGIHGVDFRRNQLLVWIEINGVKSFNCLIMWIFNKR